MSVIDYQKVDSCCGWGFEEIGVINGINVVTKLLLHLMHLVWRTREGKKGTSQYCHLAQSKRDGGKVKTQVVAYIGSVSLKPSKPERELFWMQVKSHLLDKQKMGITESLTAKLWVKSPS